MTEIKEKKELTQHEIRDGEQRKYSESKNNLSIKFDDIVKIYKDLDKLKDDMDKTLKILRHLTDEQKINKLKDRLKNKLLLFSYYYYNLYSKLFLYIILFYNQNNVEQINEKNILIFTQQIKRREIKELSILDLQVKLDEKKNNSLEIKNGKIYEILIIKKKIISKFNGGNFDMINKYLLEHDKLNDPELRLLRNSDNHSFPELLIELNYLDANFTQNSIITLTVVKKIKTSKGIKEERKIIPNLSIYMNKTFNIITNMINELSYLHNYLIYSFERYRYILCVGIDNDHKLHTINIQVEIIEKIKELEKIKLANQILVYSNKYVNSYRIKLLNFTNNYKDVFIWSGFLEYFDSNKRNKIENYKVDNEMIIFEHDTNLIPLIGTSYIDEYPDVNNRIRKNLDIYYGLNNLDSLFN
jgi:hypothetical protein